MTFNVTKTGSSDVSLVGSSQLTFTPSNWDTLQGVTVRAGNQAAVANNVATVTVAYASGASEWSAVTRQC